MNFVDKCAEALKNFESWFSYMLVIIPVMAGVCFWNTRVQKAALSTIPSEFRSFFERIAISSSYRPFVYGIPLSLGPLYFWKNIIVHKDGIEVKNKFFDSMSEYVKHGEILKFRFVFPVDGFNPMWLEITLKNSKTVSLLSADMSCAAAVIIELKKRNPDVPWTKQESTQSGSDSTL